MSGPPRRVRCGGHRSSGPCWARSRARCWSVCTLGVPAARAVAVGFLALATRGMHVDGLADTADGLGCYGPPGTGARGDARGGGGSVRGGDDPGRARGAGRGARRVGRPPGVAVAALALATTTGRAGFAWCARRGVPPRARPDWARRWLARSPRGWHRLVGSARRRRVAVVPSRPWEGPLAVALAAAVVVGLSAHTRRRFGGMTGDVLGAANELAVTAALAVLSVG